jgi:hypothetical protein
MKLINNKVIGEYLGLLAVKISRERCHAEVLEASGQAFTLMLRVPQHDTPFYAYISIINFF